MNKQFFKFVATSATSAGFNFSFRILFNYWLTYSQSIFAAYIISTTIAFILAKRFVFNNSTESTKKSAIKFIIVNIWGMFQTWAISLAMVNYILPTIGITHHTHEIGHFLGLSSLAISSFMGHKYFSFKTHRSIQESA